MHKFIFILIILSLFLPFTASAFLDGPIVPCGREGIDPCTLCHIFEMGQNIMDFIIELLLVLAPVFILVGGIFILTAGAKPDQVSIGRKIIFNAIIGLLIALLAWTLVNTLFIALSGSITKEGKEVGKIFDWPWNEINCTGGGTITPPLPPLPPPSEGEYCVCEVPVYDLDPNQYPNNASKIGTNIKVTGLSDKDACKQGCVSGNSGTYCPSTLKISEANLYCTSKSDVESKSVCGLEVNTNPTSIDCQISSECFATDLDCAATISPGTQTFNKSYVQRCFVNGEDLCNYRTLKGGDSYCPDKYPTPCTSSEKKYALYRWRREIKKFQGNAYKCSNTAYADNCRLNCQYEKTCGKITEDKCSIMSPEGSCSIGGGSFVCRKGVADQIKWADPALEEFLGCMGDNMNASDKIISSIADNSNHECFNINTWDERKQCSGSEDSCGGECCGHSRTSLHYGGNPWNIGCRDSDDALAVDFAVTNDRCKDIEKVAKKCVKDILKWPSDKRELEFECEKNPQHVHIGLEGVAKLKNCK